MKKPTAILTADIELRMIPPICRTDTDYWGTVQKKIRFLRQLQEKYDCPIFDAGDLFDKHYKIYPNYGLVRWAIENLPRNFFTVSGNHDLPGKSMDNYNQSAMAILEAAGKVKRCSWEIPNVFPFGVVYGFSWNEENPPNPFMKLDYFNIVLIHTMVWKRQPPFPNAEGYSAKQLLNKFPNADLIVSGHHHKTFTYKNSRGQLLVNPGSLMRNDADQADHVPSVFLWNADTNEVERIEVPHDKGVISREHLDVVEQKERRMDAFMEKLGEQTEIGINFHDNLEIICGSEKLDQPVKDKVWEYYEDNGNTTN